MIRSDAPGDVPVDLTREQAQRAAERELTDPIYHADDPSLLARAAEWLLGQLADLLERAGSVSPGGYPGLAVLGALAVLTAVAIRLALGRIGRAATAPDTPFEQAPQSAAQYRRLAAAHAAREAWAEAVRERLRAIVRELEQRELLAARPGRTADEVAQEAGQVLPDCAAGLRAAAQIFDDVWYGGHPASAEMYAQLSTVDEAVRAARPALAVHG